MIRQSLVLAVCRIARDFAEVVDQVRFLARTLLNIELTGMSTIELRKYQSSDTEPVYEAVLESRPELSPWMPWCHDRYSREDARTWVESRDRAWIQNEEWSFVISRRGDNLLGACGIHRIDSRNGVGELGYWVRTTEAGKGVATQAIRQIAQWAFGDPGLHRLEIVASVQNTASQRAAEKAGAIREGILRERLILNGVRHDAVLFAILKQ